MGVNPLWGCHPVRSAPPPHPPSDATALQVGVYVYQCFDNYILADQT